MSALTDDQLQGCAQMGESGLSVTLAVIRCLPSASDADITRETNRVYDAMQYPQDHTE